MHNQIEEEINYTEVEVDIQNVSISATANVGKLVFKKKAGYVSIESTGIAGSGVAFNDNDISIVIPQEFYPIANNSYFVFPLVVGITSGSIITYYARLYIYQAITTGEILSKGYIDLASASMADRDNLNQYLQQIYISGWQSTV